MQTGPAKHRRLHADVRSLDAADVGPNVLQVATFHDGDAANDARSYIWSLEPDDDNRAVRMRAWSVDSLPSGLAESIADAPACELLWRREAAQFRATAVDDCEDSMPVELVLSEQQLWMQFAADGEDYQMHRVRWFECYADIPGVGGGRPEPYDRYEGFRIHDQGDAVWFTSKEGRELGISLFLVDWPINNYEGVFSHGIRSSSTSARRPTRDARSSAMHSRLPTRIA